MGGRRVFAGTFLVIFLLIGFTGGLDASETKDPRAHPNLSPFEQWRSAYDCLQNISTYQKENCPEKYQLTAKGWVNVTTGDTELYCGRCKDHTLNLLGCLEDVMRQPHYKFESGERVADINYTIAQGCLEGFTGEALKRSNARTLKGSKTATYISVLAAWLFITYMTM
ncbi:uncharacterized protein [Elaeis guineensis]|uniref:Uncharacterized protein LOC109505897 n=1 Tax=Elaeis guineensis var. tenera TaxID=51953 RepID=A0A6J0PID0_ELAGV|nr:uncharacterized protein LOC109505897 [Elaeis guineensis]